MLNSPLDRTFQALSAPSRLKVLSIIADAGRDGICSGSIVAKMESQQSSVSTQLLLLENAELVKSERRGRNIIYWVNPEKILKLRRFLAMLGEQ